MKNKLILLLAALCLFSACRTQKNQDKHKEQQEEVQRQREQTDSLARHMEREKEGMMEMLETMEDDAMGLSAAPPSLFRNGVSVGRIESDQVTEASGLVASQLHPNVLWTHNDSGDKSRIFALTDSGKHLAEFTLAGVTLEDAEDIAVGKGRIFVADFGDNQAKRKTVSIYHFPEPQNVRKSATISQIEEIRFRYPEGKRDAEALFYDSVSDSLFIITKRERKVRLYALPSTSDQDTVLEARWLAELPFRMIVAADLRVKGQELIIKEYNQIMYWKRRPGESVSQMLSRPAILLPYTPELQGESIAWRADGSGFYTVSEERNGTIEAELLFYKRE